MFWLSSTRANAWPWSSYDGGMSSLHLSHYSFKCSVVHRVELTHYLSQDQVNSLTNDPRNQKSTHRYTEFHLLLNSTDMKFLALTSLRYHQKSFDLFGSLLKGFSSYLSELITNVFNFAFNFQKQSSSLWQGDK